MVVDGHGDDMEVDGTTRYCLGEICTICCASHIIFFVS